MISKSKAVVPLSASPETLFSDAFELQERIRHANELISEWQHRLDCLKEELMAHGLQECGNYELHNEIRTTRKINPTRFKEAFPVEYERIVTDEINRAMKSAGKVIRIQDAERMIGTDALDPICDLQSTIRTVILKKFLDGTEGG